MTLDEHVGGYGNEHYDDLAVLRSVIFEIAQGRCEHPANRRTTSRGGSSPTLTPCNAPAVELAHIIPRGMGGSLYRNTVNNTIAACRLHARSTDDLSSPEWENVMRATGAWGAQLPTLRDRLRVWVKAMRISNGWAL